LLAVVENEKGAGIARAFFVIGQLAIRGGQLWMGTI
jgi:hypothetical protein